MLHINLFAQKPVLEIVESDDVIGTNLTNKEKIKAHTYTFPLFIYRVNISEDSEYMTTLIRKTNRKKTSFFKKGYIFQYDLAHHKMKWVKDVNYNHVFYDFVGGNIFQYTGNNKLSLIDFEKGFNRMALKSRVDFVDTKGNIGIGYGIAKKKSEILFGIDLSDGKEIWQREISRKYGWSDLFITKDSALIIVASGLHKINLQTGKGWDYDCTTSKGNYKNMVAVNAMGLAVGLLTGSFFFATAPDIVTNINSNVVSDSSYYYYASKEFVSKVDKINGNSELKFPLPEKMTSNSQLILLDSTLILINKGIADMNRQVYFSV